MATLDEVEQLCGKIAELRRQITDVSAEKKKLDDQLTDEENKLLSILEASGKTSYDSSVGKFVVKHRTSVRLPADPESRAQFFEYLKSRGIFDQMISVNSNTLNAFWKQEFELAKEKGEAIDFGIPGIDMPTISQTLAFTKK